MNSKHRTLPTVSAEWARKWPDAPALIDRVTTWTYKDLHHESQRRAAAFRSIGASRGTHIGLLLPNRPEWLACAFGAWQVGAILVPLNTLYRPRELAHSLRLAEVEIVVAENEFLGHDYRSNLAEICPRLFGGQAAGRTRDLPALRRVAFSGPDGDWAAAVAAAVEAAEDDGPVHGSDDAAIFFTSGSTADPKGVVHTHASMLRAAENVGHRLGLDNDDRTYGYLPMFFNGGLVGVALATLNRGGALLLQDIFSPKEAIRLMETHGCTVFFGWPHQAEAIAGHPDFRRENLRLHKGPGANAPWARSLLADDHQCVGTWGMSETGPMAACTGYDDPLEVRAGSHGRPMPGLEIRIAANDGSHAPSGTAGEVLVRGDSLMRGYYGQIDGDAFDPDGYFHTGDRGRLDDTGHLHFLGRLGDVIKSAGVNVAAAEVEQALQQHPDIESAYVVPVPDRIRGENVAAFIVSANENFDRTALLDHCGKVLATYKVPRHFFELEPGAVPTLGSGKVDRSELRRRALDLCAGKEAK